MEEAVMKIAAQEAMQTGSDPKSPEFLDRFAETIRAESGLDLPHAYFVEEARLRLASGVVHHLVDHHTTPAQFQSSCCFDAWAKDDAA
ncbi:MAG: hypothetical protein LCH61_21005 [Proteobacteria bacterium]|jgi:hypothetical protein|nr:hypothetical protein [Pseudomonadota bacterium]